MSENLTIWCNAQLTKEALGVLQNGCEGDRLLLSQRKASNLESGTGADDLREADVAFGQPDPGQIISSERLKWVQLTSAGYTRYDRPDIAAALRGRGARLTNSSSVYDEPCAQHLLAFMLSHARCLPIAAHRQVTGAGWSYEEIRPKSRVLEGDSVLILGFGAIARRLVELLRPFNLDMKAVRRRVTADEEIPVFGDAEVDSHLAKADHIVNALPANDSTAGVMSPERFGLVKPGAVFYNVGRGTTVDQHALRQALISGRLAAAYLDVTDPEPLPADDPLWTTPNCWITPHTAGGRQEELTHLVRHFLANLNRYRAGEPLSDVVF